MALERTSAQVRAHHAPARVTMFLLAGALMLSGCSSQPPKPSAPGSGVLAIGPKTTAGFDARLQGTVSLVNGCLVVREGGAAPVVPVFVDGTVNWDVSTGLTYAGKAYAEGSVITLGGGYFDSVDPQVVSVPESCRWFGHFFIAAS